MKKINIPLISLFIFISSCSMNKKFENHLQNRVNNNKKDTIYIYFKNHKSEIKKKYMNDSLSNNNQIYYNMNFIESNKYFRLLYHSHKYGKGNLNKNPPIEKNKKYLKNIKHKTFTFDDFKNKTTYEINKFYHYNNFKTIYLIDKDENKNGKIYLRKVSFGGNFPRIQ